MNGVKYLDDLDNQQIAQVFIDLVEENRQVIIPIGFPQAGKTQLISSLMFYAIKGKDKNAPIPFKAELKIDFPYNQGRKEIDSMIQNYEKKLLSKTTPSNTLNLLGIDIIPDKLKLPTLKLAFIDISGEDIQKIKIDREGRFTKKIIALFEGLALSDSRIIFVLITPFKPAIHSDETESQAHAREDTLHFDFLNYLTEKHREILKKSTFFIIASQWDLMNSDKNETVESFIKTKREKLFNYIKNEHVIWGEYSIGKILKSLDQDDGSSSQSTLERINSHYPSVFWKKLYQVCTNKKLDNQTFWDKLFN